MSHSVALFTGLVFCFNLIIRNKWQYTYSLHWFHLLLKPVWSPITSSFMTHHCCEQITQTWESNGCHSALEGSAEPESSLNSSVLSQPPVALPAVPSDHPMTTPRYWNVCRVTNTSGQLAPPEAAAPLRTASALTPHTRLVPLWVTKAFDPSWQWTPKQSNESGRLV